MKKLTIFVLALGLFACNEDQVEVSPATNADLIGKWDVYYSIWDDGQESFGRGYSVLLNYEHGFEIVADGTYYSRYVMNNEDATNPDSMVETSFSSGGGTWQAEEGNISFFSKDNHSIKFSVLKLDTEELVIKNEFGLTWHLEKDK